MKTVDIVGITVLVFLLILILGHLTKVSQNVYVVTAILCSLGILIVLCVRKTRKEDYKNGLVVDWIRKIDSSLNDECFQCVQSSIEKLWSDKTIQRVMKLSEDVQRLILDALLISNCKQICMVKSDLKLEEITDWISWLKRNSNLFQGGVLKQISDDCQACLQNYCFSNWSVKILDRVRKLPLEEQENIIKSILLMNCQSCKTEESLTREIVQKWVNSILDGGSEQCYSCVVDLILKLWSVDAFRKVLSMTKIGQERMLQALIAVSCQAECTIPTGVDSRQVSKFIADVFRGSNKQCQNCILQEIIKRWTQETFEKVNSLRFSDQLVVLNSMSRIYCNDSCNVNSCSYPLLDKYGQ